MNPATRAQFSLSLTHKHNSVQTSNLDMKRSVVPLVGHYPIIKRYVRLNSPREHVHLRQQLLQDRNLLLSGQNVSPSLKRPSVVAIDLLFGLALVITQ